MDANQKRPLRSRVPILSGNLSVEYLMRRAAGEAPPPAGSHRRDLERWAALGVTAVEDYLAWGVIEPREGHLDFEFHRVNQRQCHELGLQYLVYPWVHVLPAWYLASDRFVGARCLEHDRTCAWPSLFAPATLALYRRFYDAIREHLAPPDGICVALPADYGEVGYPTGWASWVAPLAAPFDHVHPGFWAGDDFAREAFRAFLLAEAGGSMDALNRRFGTRFADPAAITPTDAEGNEDYRLCAARFYVGSMTAFVDRVLALVRERFPDTPLTVKLGHGGESLCYGIEPSRLVKVASRHGAKVRTTQASLRQIHQQRIDSPCRRYGVALGSEAPAEIGREATVGRIFTDASSSVVEYFDFPEHLVGSRDLLERLHPLLRPDTPRQVDVALLFATTDHLLSPTQGFPPVLLELADTLRDRFDHEVFDEDMVQEGALDDVRVLGVLEGRRLDAATQEAVLAFARSGGCVVLGPAACEVTGALGEVLRDAPDAAAFVHVHGDPVPSMVVDVGGPGDRLLLSGQWYAPEDACQFRDTTPRGETSRWCGARAALDVPVKPDTDYLVEIDCWVHPHTVALSREVRVSGHWIGAIERPGMQRFAAWVRGDQIGGRRVAQVELCNQTFRMHERGLGEDRRDLGVAVVWVRLTESGAPAVDPVRAPEVQWRGAAGDDLWERGAVAHGAGCVVACRDVRLMRLVTLLASAVQRHSRVARSLVAGPFATEIPVGVRTTVFQDRLLLWNRTLTQQILQPRANGAAWWTLPPGALAVVDGDGARVV